MPLAPRVMAWQQRLANTPGPLTNAGSPVGGTPFLLAGLETASLMVEAAFGADLAGDPNVWSWIDITSDVRQADGQVIHIVIGRGDESSQTQPADCTFQLDNTSGAYSAYNPSGSHYPYVRRNTPIRVRVTLDSGANWHTRFYGFANGFTPSWDTSAHLAVVSVSASGVLRRLLQGTNPLRSAMYRAISQTNPVAYWPFEENAQATTATSPLLTVNAMTLVRGVPRFGAATGPAGAPVLAELPQDDTKLTGIVPVGSSSTSWRIETAIKITYDTLSSGISTFDWFTEGTYTHWLIQISNTTGFYITRIQPDGTTVFHDSNVIPASDVWYHISVNVTQSGGNADITFKVNGVITVSTSAAFTVGRITSVNVNPVGTGAHNTQSIGHVAAWAPWSSSIDTYDAFIGHAGESATTRPTRLCSEEGVSASLVGISDIAMGSQGTDTFLSLLRECEAADDGILYDGFSSGIASVARTSQYNGIPTLAPDMAGGQIAPPFSPVDDDQRNRNLVKVTRKDGSFATYEDSTGPLGTANIGTYDSSLTVNTSSYTGLYDRAAWEVHKGTVEGLRYPTLSLNLAATPSQVPAWLATPLLSRIDVLNVEDVATQHPPGTVSLVLEGYAESLSPFVWDIVANCSPYQPFEVFEIEGTANRGRLDASVSTLGAGISTADTSLSVATPSDPLWTTTATFPADFPLDIGIEGEQVTVTAISGAASPQTFTVVRSVNGVVKTHPANAVVKLWNPGVIAL